MGTYSQQRLPIPGKAAVKKGLIASNLTPTHSTSLAEYIRQLSNVSSVREDPFFKSSGSRQSCNWLQRGAVVLPPALCQSETMNGNYTFEGSRCIGYSHGGRNVDIAMIGAQLQTRQLIGDGELQSLTWLLGSTFSLRGPLRSVEAADVFCCTNWRRREFVHHRLTGYWRCSTPCKIRIYS